MYRTVKPLNKKLVALLFMSIICTAKIIAGDDASQNIRLAHGLETHFTDPRYTLYSDRDLSARSITPVFTGRTKLHCVTSIKEAQEALQYGADINAVDNNGYTPIQYLIMRKNYPTAIYLLQHDARICDADKSYLLSKFHQYKNKFATSENALHCATSIKEIDDVLKYGADINAVDNNGITAIQYMIVKKNIPSAIYLLQNKAKISDRDKKYLLEQYKNLYGKQKALF